MPKCSASIAVPCPHRVVAVAYDRLSIFEYGIVVDVFGVPRPSLEKPWYEFRTAPCGRREALLLPRMVAWTCWAVLERSSFRAGEGRQKPCRSRC